MKNLLTIAMITLAAFAAKADLYLYWTVDVSDTQWADTAVYAGLYSGDATLDAAPIGEEAQTNVGIYTSYWVKLYDNAMSEIAVSAEAVTYAQLSSMGLSPIWDSSSTDGGPSGNYYTFSSFVIPEPTSGLMLLLGLGALALKRKVA